MRLVTQTSCLAQNFGDEETIRILAKAGFDAVDWSFFPMVRGEGIWCTDEWRSHALKLKEVAVECGIGFSQAHAPFPSSRGEEPFDTDIIGWIKRSMAAAAVMGVKNIVVHPKHHIPYAENKAALFEENVRFYRSLIPCCEEYGIRVCAENMWQRDKRRNYIVDSSCSTPEDFCGLLDAVGSPWVVGCLDLGHTALVGIEPQDFIRAMGKNRLQALHVQDVNYVQDCHTLPFLEKLDWGEVAKALAEIGYEGDFTLEADHLPLSFPKELQPDVMVLMAKTGRYIMGLIEKFR
ncbi:MAG: sugar phosphate isomerase/epimerase [Oscillospiraceae bacterium]|jgi:L-ribulose-5-phosphate 3-epimerase|nr:sugar phosphate isomerase/epimerase [Oscillospiraceae bacterium]